MPSFTTRKPAAIPPAESSGHALPAFVHDYLASGSAEGVRNDTLHRCAQQFFAARLSLEEAEARLLPRALADGLKPSEARRLLSP